MTRRARIVLALAFGASFAAVGCRKRVVFEGGSDKTGLAGATGVTPTTSASATMGGDDGQWTMPP